MDPRTVSRLIERTAVGEGFISPKAAGAPIYLYHPGAAEMQYLGVSPALAKVPSK
jgi:hypothetical protein